MNAYPKKQIFSPLSSLCLCVVITLSMSVRPAYAQAPGETYLPPTTPAKSSSQVGEGASPAQKPYPKKNSWDRPTPVSTNALRRGRSSLSFQFPMGGSDSYFSSLSSQKLGFWHMFSRRVNFGLNLGVSFDSAEVVTTPSMNGEPELTEQRTRSEVIFSPAIKYYTRTQSTVALYFLTQAHFQVYSDGDGDTVTDPDAIGLQVYSPEEEPQLSLTLGFGVEWFPVEVLSIGGHVGLNLDLLRQGGDEIRLETFTSTLTAQVYF